MLKVGAEKEEELEVIKVLNGEDKRKERHKGIKKDGTK
jgi:hypothetical protein